MKIISRLFRLGRINFILARYCVGQAVLGQQVRFLSYCNPYYWGKTGRLPPALRIRLAIEALGPIFVKAGQMLSTRRDLLPDDIALELAKLQDKVPPFSGKLAKEIIEQSLEAKIERIFADFDMQALASASIAQVHAATLFNGESVVVKVLRPNIDKIIDRDTDLLISLANLAGQWPRFKALKPVEIIKEITQTLYDELDLIREGANAAHLGRHFVNSKQLYIPKIKWSYSRHNVLVMERIHGIPIHDLARLKNEGVNLHKLAQTLIEVCFTQMFRDSFFHADVHPGNIFVSHQHPESPTCIMVDFGIVGSLSANDKRYIAENMIAFFKRDYQRVAELHIACGWLSPDTRIDQFEGAIRAVSEPIFEQPLQDISFGQLLLRLFQVARRFNINIQPQLVLLQKTLVNVEGLSRHLAPELDLWSIAAPEIEKWLKKQIGVKAFFKHLKENLPLWSEQLPMLPSLAYEVLQEKKLQQERERFRQIQRENLSKSSTKYLYFIAGMLSMSLILLVYSQL